MRKLIWNENETENENISGYLLTKKHDIAHYNVKYHICLFAKRLLLDYVFGVWPLFYEWLMRDNCEIPSALEYRQDSVM